MVMDAAPTSDATTEVKAPVAVPPATDTPADKAPEPDWRGQAEKEAEARKAAEKRANDAKAEAGRALKAAREAREEAERQSKLLDKVLAGEVTNKDEADAFRAKSASESTRSSLLAEIKTEVARVRALTDALGVDPVTDDNFEEAFDFLAEADDAAKAGLPGTFRRALKQAKQAHDAAIERIKAKQAPAPAKPAEKVVEPSPEKVAADAAELDRARTRALSKVAGTSQATTMSDDNLWKAYGRGEIEWSKDVREAGKRLGFAE